MKKGMGGEDAETMAREDSYWAEKAREGESTGYAGPEASMAFLNNDDVYKKTARLNPK